MSQHQAFKVLEHWLNQQVIGQSSLVNRILIALLADGHLLVEGAPGLAKTRAIVALSKGLDADFQRLQFTPDLLPSDLTGTEIFNPHDGQFSFRAGPMFHNLLLADEINRAPAKVQSALLEAMAEQQISVAGESHKLPELFLVMATQNPIEQEGTYPLPEAQLDRFLMKVTVGYPDIETEKLILALARNEVVKTDTPEPETLSQANIFQARQELMQLHMADEVEAYLLRIIEATRQPKAYDDQLAQWLEFGASPRATIALDRCARAVAWLDGRDFVTPDDIRQLCPEILRHRLIPSFKAEASGISNDQIIERLLECVALP
ncbi:AAA family ATPase [Pelagibaculum spongiae]|uniref:AAA family ATPase n=1 Tax=Pelagibaculum spongiae TaxID=2080658 RepID=A0A2V1GP05_9GAMM|nr:MoxR family ATPase [Pelagibaculum spongiae]PVZ64305.1 AAA family ATPase [Pelagibaculum spongiae]